MLRRTDSGEADRRLTLFTPSLGKLDVVAKGAKKAGSRLAGSSEPMVRAVFTWAEGRHRRFVTQVQPVTSFPHLRSDFDRTSAALSLLELYAVSTPYESPIEGLYEILVQALEAMEAAEDPLPALVWAEAKLLDAEGVHPDWTVCVDTGSALTENPSWVSLAAGGPISSQAAGTHLDAFPASAEVLISLQRTSSLDGPPDKLRYAKECLVVLFRFWRHTLGERLPASESLIHNLTDGTG